MNKRFIQLCSWLIVDVDHISKVERKDFNIIVEVINPISYMTYILSDVDCVIYNKIKSYIR